MLITSLVYYGVYNECGASTFKAPVDPEEDRVSRVDLDLIPPPLSVASLKSFVSAKEGITGSCQLFTNGDIMTPVIDDHILTEDGKWPGFTPDDHVMFKFTTQLPLPTFSEGSRYMILNSAGKALGMTYIVYVLDVAASPQHRFHPATVVCITSGYLINSFISFRCIVFSQDSK